MNKKKGTFIGVLISVLLTLSIGAVSTYDAIKKSSIENRDIYWNEHELYYITSKMLVLDAQLKGYTTEEQLLEHYFAVDEELLAKTPQENKSLFIEDDKQSFLDEFRLWQKQYKDDADFAYMMKDTKTGAILSNVEDDLFTINDHEQLLEKYQSYISVSFDEKGTLEITDSTFGNMLSDFEGRINQLPFNVSFNSYVTQNRILDGGYEETSTQQVTSVNSLKDVSFAFAIPNEIKPTGYFYDTIISGTITNAVNPPLVMMGLGMACIMFLFMLCYPIRIVKECNPYKTLGKIKIEFYTLFIMGALFLIIIGLFWFGQGAILEEYAHNTFTEMNLNVGQLRLICVGLWMVFAFLITLLGYEFKMLFHLGLKTFIKERTCLGWLYKKAVRVIEFDLNDERNKSLLKIVGFNFIIMSIITFFFTFGFFFAFIYSCVLFVLLRNKFSSVQKDYNVILKATKRLSDGDFDVDISEDVGMFNTLGDSLSNIKEGYKKAVKEEVKSQRMKTELISNVSHDLKTPLTSIITYVDLLKKEDIDVQQRSQYVEVLDRNALRLKQLIEDLFEVSKANSGSVSLNRVEVDIVSLMKQAIFECSDALQNQQLDVRVAYAQDKVLCSLDSAKTYRVFENLLMNISKYALHHTRVYVDVYERDDLAYIVLKNISAHEMQFDGEEIVERFVQGDKSRTSGGSGLGLAIAKSFTEIQGGHLHVEVDGDLFKVTIQYPMIKDSI